MKSLRPSMRENKRYLLIKGNVQDIEKAILEAVGILGASKTGLAWIKRENDGAIISINREALNDVRASFALWPSGLSVKKVSGSLKNLKK